MGIEVVGHVEGGSIVVAGDTVTVAVTVTAAAIASSSAQECHCRTPDDK